MRNKKFEKSIEKYISLKYYESLLRQLEENTVMSKEAKKELVHYIYAEIKKINNEE